MEDFPIYPATILKRRSTPIFKGYFLTMISDTNPDNLDFLSNDKYAAIRIEKWTPIPSLSDRVTYFCRRCGSHFTGTRGVAYRGVWDRERGRTLKLRCPSIQCITREAVKK